MSEPKTILVVDDTAPLRHIVSIYFTQAGYKVVEASDGEMALAKVNDNELDLIFTDVMMPKMDGYAVCRALRGIDKTKNTPIIVCTAKGGQEDIVLAMKAGATDYVVKPFSKETIMKKVEKFLGPSPAAVKAATEAKAAHEQAQQKHAEQHTPLSKDTPDRPTKTLQTHPPAKDTPTGASGQPAQPQTPQPPKPQVPPKS